MNALCSAHRLDARAIVHGEPRDDDVLNPIAPQLVNRIRVKTDRGSRAESVGGEPTYVGQFRAFLAAVRGERPIPTDGPHGAANMRVIDAIYTRAGLKPRGT